mmetsp:Transcript_32691/g.92748  ORF Transcript_32691/g.92748 Transcript_32691/m.92748 type:complete len:326 (-) Transcript_32691:637-1614(-)
MSACIGFGFRKKPKPGNKKITVPQLCPACTSLRLALLTATHPAQLGILEYCIYGSLHCLGSHRPLAMVACWQSQHASTINCSDCWRPALEGATPGAVKTCMSSTIIMAEANSCMELTAAQQRVQVLTAASQFLVVVLVLSTGRQRFSPRLCRLAFGCLGLDHAEDDPGQQSYEDGHRVASGWLCVEGQESDDGEWDLIQRPCEGIGRCCCRGQEPQRAEGDGKPNDAAANCCSLETPGMKGMLVPYGLVLSEGQHQDRHEWDAEEVVVPHHGALIKATSFAAEDLDLVHDRAQVEGVSGGGQAVGHLPGVPRQVEGHVCGGTGHG